MADSPRLAELRRRLHGDPRSLAFAALAEELRRAGAWQEAIDTCVGGLVHHPDYTSARVTLGRALLEAGQPDAAREELEGVVGKVPENLVAQRALIEAYRELGLVADAVAHCRHVCSLVPQSSEIAGLLEELDPSPAPAVAPPLPPEERAADPTPHVIDDDPLDEWPLLLVDFPEFGDAEAGSAPPPDVERAPGTGLAAVSDPGDVVTSFDRALDLELGVDRPAPDPATVPMVAPPESNLAAAAIESSAPGDTTGLPEQPPAAPEPVENALERFLAAIRRERGGPPPVDLAS